MRVFQYLFVVLVVAFSLSGCSKSVRYSSDLTEEIQGWTAAQIDRYRVFVMGPAGNPSAVVLDNPASGVNFVDAEWTRVQGEAARATVRKGLDFGLKVARLEGDSGVLLGFLLGADVETPSELRYFQLRIHRDGARAPSYQVLTLVFPNPKQYGNGARH